MADIKTSRNHNLEESELQAHLEDLAAEMNSAFGIQSQFDGNVVRFSGKVVKSGAVTWDSNTVAIELTLGLMGKVFKKQIAKEIEKRIDALAAS